jgi:predicted MFS family arabinose efflux permease
MNMFSGMAYSIIAPLFPIIAERHGINEDIIGYLIGTCALSSFIASPFVPMLIKNLGGLIFYI